MANDFVTPEAQKQLDELEKRKGFAQSAVQKKKKAEFNIPSFPFKEKNGKKQNKPVIVSKSNKGLTTKLSFKRALPTEWSDMGLIFGSQFKNYESRNVFPDSGRSRLLHPQEREELEASIIREKLFNDLSFRLSLKKKLGDKL